ncbi:TPA: Tn3 family transposase, partial [Escherichia coli]|nr:Tn3 family transposase [Escherichia coli]
DSTLIQQKHRPWLINKDVVHPQRYEWLLYRQLASRLNGRIYLSNVTKYRALEDDLIASSIQPDLLASSTLEKLKQPIQKLLQVKQIRLTTSLEDVARHIDNGD